MAYDLSNIKVKQGDNWSSPNEIHKIANNYYLYAPIGATGGLVIKDGIPYYCTISQWVNDTPTIILRGSLADGYTNISRNGLTFTATQLDGSTETFTQQDNNTIYSANNGVALNGTTFYNSGVRSIGTGSSNGTISVNTNGTSTNVSVKGLDSAAYTKSTAYAAASHNHGAGNITSGTLPIARGGTGATGGTSSTPFTNTTLHYWGKFCCLTVYGKRNISDSWTNITLGTIPSGYRPASAVWAPFISANTGGRCGVIEVAKEGVVKIYGDGGTALGNNEIMGQCVWVAP